MTNTEVAYFVSDVFRYYRAVIIRATPDVAAAIVSPELRLCGAMRDDGWIPTVFGDMWLEPCDGPFIAALDENRNLIATWSSSAGMRWHQRRPATNGSEPNQLSG